VRGREMMKMVVTRLTTETSNATVWFLPLLAAQWSGVSFLYPQTESERKGEREDRTLFRDSSAIPMERK
jgi:hypothetical protein